jgi:uncharacterized phiE125 gp8 family phage protein
MSDLKLITPPRFDPVTVREVKGKMGMPLDFLDQDAFIYLSIKAATAHFERYGQVQRALMPQTWEKILQRWPSCDYVELPLPPLVSVTSVTYLDEDGDSAVMDAADYIVSTDQEPGGIVLAANASWPSTTLLPVDPIRIRYECGYADASLVPPEIRLAILLLVEKHYDGHDLSETGGMIDAAVRNGTVGLISKHAF